MFPKNGGIMEESSRTDCSMLLDSCMAVDSKGYID
jgi:hypothetical protein